jgi:UDPglucose--hexose-1-phosphate uridylyltransferase
VVADEHFVALEPFAPRFPYETWILPKKHNSAFEAITDDGLYHLASMLKETLGRINDALSRPHYNFVIHTAPCNDPFLLYYHWHIEIMPKLTNMAGQGWASHQPTPLEDAARYLRASGPPFAPRPPEECRRGRSGWCLMATEFPCPAVGGLGDVVAALSGELAARQG